MAVARPVLSSASHRSDESGLALDGNATTRWTSGVAMQPAMYYEAEFATPVMLSGIDARAADDTDNPKDWTVALMDDSGGHGYREVAKGSGPIVAAWPAERAQVIKIVCNSQEDFYWWSIVDLLVDAVDIPPVVEPPVADPPVVPPVVPPTEPPVVPPAEPEPGAVTDVGWRTWSEELCRLVVEGMAAKHGWVMKQREIIDFTTGQVAVKQAVIWTIGKVGPDGERDYWPFEIS
jgi:hypothetical protein